VVSLRRADLYLSASRRDLDESRIGLAGVEIAGLKRPQEDQVAPDISRVAFDMDSIHSIWH